MHRTTAAVEVKAATRYLPARSRPADGFFLFAYTITITNRSAVPLRLLARHWVITDAHGHEEEVRGPGVVGRQPLLGPGESFTYTSACPLRTPLGAMRGSYLLADEHGHRFETEIPAFPLRRGDDAN